MALIILILFIAVPIAEIALFVEVGGQIGLWPTLGVVVLTAIFGTALLRQQGLDTLRRVQDSLARDRIPVAEMFDGLCLLFAGALLLTPGFLTDAVGFLLFVPPLRSAAARAIGRAILSRGQVNVSGFSTSTGASGGQGAGNPHGNFHGGTFNQGQKKDQSPPAGGSVIDGEYQDVTEPSARIDHPPKSNDNKLDP